MSETIKHLFSPQMQAVYEVLQDAESRFIYEQYAKIYLSDSKFTDWNSKERYEMLCGVLRFAYDKHMNDSREVTLSHSFLQCILDSKVKYDKLFLYPAGNFAPFLAKVLMSYGVEIGGFIDSNIDKQGTTFLNRPVISLEQFKSDYKNDKVLIASYGFMAEIIDDIVQANQLGGTDGIIPNHIERLNEMQYFGPAFLTPKHNEIYLGVGCWNGGTMQEFIKFCKQAGHGYKKIIGIESSKSCIPIIEKDMLGYDNVEILPYAAHSKEGTMDLYLSKHGMNVTASENMSDWQVERIRTRRIDDIVNDKVTFLTMDVEGGEYDALLGAANTIKENRPRLAISIYHKECDIIEIPWFIHNLVPDYRFYIRHHAMHPWETILYAI